MKITPIYEDEIRRWDQMVHGCIYISKKYQTASHLCACGCGGLTVTPLGNGEWTLTDNNGLITLRPSIGNWLGEKPYHAHYYITNNTVEFL